MKYKIHPQVLFLAPTLLISLLSAGCTHIIKPPKAPYTGYAPQAKVPLKVAVNITDDLRQAKWEKHSMGDKWVIPIGQSIATNTPVLARHTFTEVVDISEGVSTPNGSVDAILTPKLAYIGRTTGATSFGKSIIGIKVEWTLSNPAGNAIWVDTVNGESSGSTGWTNPEKILKQAIEDLLTKSQQALASAEAIRSFAAQRKTAGANK